MAYRARGINYRKSTAVAGFFSQIGQLYMVHHIWSRFVQCFVIKLFQYSILSISQIKRDAENISR